MSGQQLVFGPFLLDAQAGSLHCQAQLEQLKVNGWRTLSVKLLNSLALNFRREKVW
jgi:hypothetical protein